MTNEQKSLIENMRKNGCSYSVIANKLGIPKDTIKKHCQRHKINVASTPVSISCDEIYCKFCGKTIPAIHGRKQPKFCSEKCRRAWWKAHPNYGKRKAYYSFVCIGCGQEFQAYGNSKRKYCSHNCYIRSRFKGGDVNEQ